MTRSSGNDSKDRARGHIKSLGKGLNILSTFSNRRPTLTLSQVASLNGMNLVTARRYLLTLVDLGYVGYDQETRCYHLTSRVLRLGSWVVESMDLKSRLMPHMKDLTLRYNVTTGCGILEGAEIIYLERLRSNDVVNLDLTAGSRLPVYCSSLGKAILAHLPEEECRRVIEQIEFVAFTPYTLKNEEDLLADLARTRKRGFAVSKQELTLGLKTLGIPIMDKKGNVEGAFYVSYPSSRDQNEGLHEIMVEELLRVAETLSGGESAANE